MGLATPLRPQAPREKVRLNDPSSYPVFLKLTHARTEALMCDAGGDMLDAVHGAGGLAPGQARYGRPEAIDPLESWIVSAPLA